MDSQQFMPSLESTAANKKKSRRRRPLHTCGVSIFAIASKAYTKARDSNGPIGSTTKRMTKLATITFPLIHSLQCQWLAVLSFADDHIILVEKIIEKIFPPSARLFDKIDEFVQIAETVPGIFDEVVSKFPNFIHQVPFLDSVLAFLISWLKFLISKLTRWGSNNMDREIRVDINCNNLNVEGESAEQAYLYIESPSHVSISASSLNEPGMICQESAEQAYLYIESPSHISISASSLNEPGMLCQEQCHIDSTTGNQCESMGRLSQLSDCLENETMMFKKPVKPVVMECSYKEMLEKGKEEKEEESFKFDSPKAITDEKEAVERCKNNETGSNESIGKEHPILELFEASWHTKSGK